MKKAVLILIGIIYVASIVIVSLFGMRAVMYDEVIPVLNIECVNETKGNIQVDDSGLKKVIRIAFTEPGDIESLTGTVLQLETRVLPDNATNKEIRYVYNRESYPQVKFHTLNDRETGAIVFTAPALFTLRIYSTDGTNVFTEVLISCR